MKHKVRVRRRGSKWYRRWTNPVTGRQMEAVMEHVTSEAQAWEVATAYAREEARLHADAERIGLGLQPTTNSRRSTSWSDLAGEVMARKRVGSEWAKHDWRVTGRFAKHLGGDRLMALVSTEDIESYRDARLAGGSKPETVKKELAFIRSVTRKAFSSGATLTDAGADVKSPIVRRRKKRIVTPDELERICKAAIGRADPESESDMDHAAERVFRWRFLLMTGLRSGQAKKIRWRDVDFARGVITVPTDDKGQTDAIREETFDLPIIDSLRGLLVERSGSPGARIFPRQHNWRRDLVADCKAAGVEHVRPHDFRASCASLIVNSPGVSPAYAQAYLRHANLATTMSYYVQVDLENVRAAGAALDIAMDKIGAIPCRDVHADAA